MAPLNNRKTTEHTCPRTLWELGIPTADKTRLIRSDKEGQFPIKGTRSRTKHICPVTPKNRRARWAHSLYWHTRHDRQQGGGSKRGACGRSAAWHCAPDRVPLAIGAASRWLENGRRGPLPRRGFTRGEVVAAIALKSVDRFVGSYL